MICVRTSALPFCRKNFLLVSIIASISAVVAILSNTRSIAFLILLGSTCTILNGLPFSFTLKRSLGLKPVGRPDPLSVYMVILGLLVSSSVSYTFCTISPISVLSVNVVANPSPAMVVSYRSGYLYLTSDERKHISSNGSFPLYSIPRFTTKNFGSRSPLTVISFLVEVIIVAILVRN